VTKEARERSFDELAIGLANGRVSRREALKWLGAALLGGALAFTPKVAEAAGCGQGLRACGRNEQTGEPICYDPDVFFCCKTHSEVFKTTVSNICTRGTQYCCITSDNAQCLSLMEPCTGRIRLPH
jgi:hypothetical protein